MDELKTYDARDIGVVTAEIKTLNNQYRVITVSYAIEVGRRLTEAKSLLHHGEWGDWLENQVQFSQRTANNFMKVFEEYGDAQLSLFGDPAENSQTIANLPITKVLRLLALPSDERDDFLAGNDVEGMSTRELEEAIKARKDAEARADVAEQKAADLSAALEASSGVIEGYERAAGELRRSLLAATEEKEKLTGDLDKAKKDLQKLKDHPKIPQVTMDKFKADAEAAAEKQFAQEKAAAEKKLTEAEAKRAEAERREAELRSKLDAINRDARLSDPDLLAFKMVFEQVQEDWTRLNEIYVRIEGKDRETAKKLQQAIRAWFLKEYGPLMENKDE